MIKIKNLIGTEVDNITRIIELGLLKNLQRSLSWEHNYNNILPMFLLGHLINNSQVYKTLGLHVNHVLLSRESIISHRALKIGESIHIKTFLRDAYEQQASSNPIGFVVLDSIGNINTNIAFYCERVLAVRGGFSRGRNHEKILG